MYRKIVQFIRELYNEPTDPIPLHAPVFIGNERKYLEECIDSTFVSSVGQFVDRFEEEIAKYTGAKKAVSCVNGTSALHLALQLVGVEPDTEVITQPLTFFATDNDIKYCGAEPVFLDVDMDTMGLSPEVLKTWLYDSTVKRLNHKKKQHETINKNTGRRISACVPMHTFGHPCRIDEVVEICNNYNIPVVEDAAESMGSFYLPREIREANISPGKGQHTGTFGEIGVLSFNGNKIITTGGGGMLLFKDDKLAKKAKHLTTQAKIPHPWEFNHDAIGYNYRMPNLNAALGLAQLEELTAILKIKRNIANTYSDFFSKIGIKFITEPENAQSNYWLNSLILNNKIERDAFLKYSNDNGIMTRPVWTLMNKLEIFKDCQIGDLKHVEWLEDRVINIPSSVIINNE